MSSLDASTTQKGTPPLLIAIVGPTASGKTELANLVAKRLDSAVVSVDAMQVYRGMDIGTAKEPVHLRPVPLYMIDRVDICEPYSAQLFQCQARKIIDQMLLEAKTPVLCGGTGLYLNAVIDEMNFAKGTYVSPARKYFEEFAQTKGAEELYELLRKKDPASANVIHPNNVRRIIRALEMAEEGQSYAQQLKGFHHTKEHYQTKIFGLSWPRDMLYQRINKRVDQMMEDGLLDEVKSLRAHGLEKNTTAAQAIGYKELLEYLDQEKSLAEAVELIKQRTRRYAKRQLSWFTHDARVIWLEMQDLSLKEATDKIAASFESKH